MNEVLEQPVSKLENLVARDGEGVKAAAVPRVGRGLARVVFSSLLVTIVLATIPYGTVEPWWVAVFECLVFVLGLLALVQMFAGKSRPAGGNLSLLAPLMFLVLFVVLQSLPLFSGTGTSGISFRESLSADPYGTRLVAIKLFALILAGALMLHYTNSKGRLRALVYVVIGIGVASAVFGLLRKNVQQSPGFFLPYLRNDGRGFGQFINKNHFAFLMEMSLGLSLGLLVGEVGRHRRTLVLLPILGLLWFALVSSNSRGGIIASLCQLLILGALLDPVRHLTNQRARTTWGRLQNLAGGLALRGFLVVCLIVLFAYGVGWVGGEPVVSNFELAATDFRQQATYNNSNTSRKEMWSTTWKMIKAAPIAGTGFGGYWIAVTKYHNASGEVTPQQAHNDYLELLAGGGLLGAALVIWFLFGFLRQARERLRSRDPYCRAAALGALTGIFGVAIHSFVDFGLHVTVNALLLSALMVIAVHDNQVAGTATNNLLTQY